MKCISYGIQSIVESIMIISFRLSLLVVFYCGNNLVKQSFFDKKNFQIHVVWSFSFILLVVMTPDMLGSLLFLLVIILR